MSCRKREQTFLAKAIETIATLAAVVLLWSCAGATETVAKDSANDDNGFNKKVGCQKDTDCKGARVCEQSTCVASVETGKKAVSSTGNSKFKRQKPGAKPLAMFGGDQQNSGRVAGTAPRQAPELLWSYPVGQPIVGSPTVGPDGMVYATSHNGSLFAVTNTGTLRWRFDTKDRLWSTPALTRGGTVYFGSDDDNLYAVNSQTGKEQWHLKIGGCRDPLGFGPEGSRCDADGGPTIGNDGTIYLGGDGVHAVWPDGTLRWKFATSEHVATAPAISNNGFVVYAGCLDDSMYAIRSDGTQSWAFRTNGDIESAPTVGADGTIYFGSDDDAVYALYPHGAVAWKVLTGDDVRSSPAIGPDGTIYVGSYDRYLYAIAKDGQVRWRFPTGGRIHGSPVVTQNGVIIFGSQDDRLYAVNADGKLRWSLQFSADVDTSPTLTSDGILYVAGDDGAISAFSTDSQKAL